MKVSDESLESYLMLTVSGSWSSPLLLLTVTMLEPVVGTLAVCLQILFRPLCLEKERIIKYNLLCDTPRCVICCQSFYQEGFTTPLGT